MRHIPRETTIKACSRCGTPLPPGRFDSWCCACRTAYQRSYRSKNRATLNTKRRARYAERRDAARLSQESSRPDTFTRRRRKVLRDRRWQTRHAAYWSAYKTRWKRVNREKVRGQAERYKARQRGPQPRPVRPIASVSYVPATSTQPASWVLFDETAPTSTPLAILSDPSAVLQWAMDHDYDLTLARN